MLWTYLGHAMWLAEAGGLRIVFDPQLGDSHHDGVFEVFPRRTVDVPALAPDLVVVTHRHPDHFDLPSLRLLAQHFPDALLVTADALVARAAARLGFERVSVLSPWQHLPLEGLDLLTTPSFCDVEEWGMMIATVEGVVWNQVDTELRSSETVRSVLEKSAGILRRPALINGPDLGIVRWQPMLEVSAALGTAMGFPHVNYSNQLEKIVACGASAVIPGASGSRHIGHAAWLNQHAYPVRQSRLQRDLRRRCPQMEFLPSVLGNVYSLEGGVVSMGGCTDLITVEETVDDRVFRPLTIPPVVDRDPEGRGVGAVISVIDPWVREVLAPAVGLAFRQRGLVGYSALLEVVTVNGPVFRALQVTSDGVLISMEPLSDPDMHNVISASELAAVIDGRTHWGRALLSGQLRANNCLYVVEKDALTRPRLPPFFLYLGLSYAQATTQWVAHMLDQLAPLD